MSETTGFVPKGSDPIYILHIEDSETISKFTQRLLSRTFGAKVTSVKSGEEAMEVIGTKQWSVVLSDWNIENNMTGGDVFGVVETSHPHLVNKYVFMSDDKKAAELCAEKGLPYLPKPSRADQICATVGEVIATS